MVMLLLLLIGTVNAVQVYADVVLGYYWLIPLNAASALLCLWGAWRDSRL
jgi:hypothetical protein